MKSQNTLIGAGLIIAAFFLISTMDMLVKMVSVTVPIVMAVWFRNLFQSSVMFGLARIQGQNPFQTNHPWMQFFRAVTLLMTTVFFFIALSRIPLADAAALIQTNPVLITLGAAIFLGEGLGPRRIIGISLACFGAALILRPGTDLFQFDAICAIMASVAFTVYSLLTRLVRDDSPTVSTFLPALLGAVCLTLALPWVWSPIASGDLVILIALGAAGSGGHFLLSKAFTFAPASVLAPFSYASVLFAIFWGMTLFGEFPPLLSFVGAGIIILAGVYVWWRDQTAEG